MDTLTDLLVILLYLSALYAALGLLAAVGEGLARLATWRLRHPRPSVGRRQRRARPRRRTERDEPGSAHRPTAASPRAKVRVLSLASTAEAAGSG
jgi:hypothetical protein